MTRYDKLKQEISAMSLEDFVKHFVSGKGVKDYICGEIRVPYAHCSKQDYVCVDCIIEYLKGEVAE